MSALCAFPPLIPAGGGGGGVYSAGYMADVSSSSNRSSSFSAYSNAMATSQQSRISSASIPAYGSTFAAFHQQPTTAVGAGKSTAMKMTQPESAWSSRTTSSTDVPPAAKRRCTDKMRSTAVWSDQHAQIWPSSNSIPASVCPSGCTMCHLQRQQQQQQYPSLNGFQQAYDCRRPLQEKHQNREESLAATNMAAVGHLKSAMKSADQSAATTVRMPNVNRSLSVDPKKDYSAPLHVDCSVEYDLPRIVRPPPGAQPLLILAPPRPSAVPLATPTGYQTWTTTANSLSHPPQWNQQGVGTRIKSDKPSAASVKSHPAAMQQQKLNSTISGAIRNNSTGGGGAPCGCPSCCLAARPSLPPPNVYAGPTGVGGGAGWMNQHWSPPAGATASSAGFNYAPPQQQQQQQQQPTYQQMAAFHNIDQQPQQPQTVINRRRKRSPEVIPSSGGGGGMSTTSDKMQRLYSTAQWMPNPSSIQAAAEAAFVAAAAAAAAAASHRYVTSSPAWMHASAQPLKFHC